MKPYRASGLSCFALIVGAFLSCIVPAFGQGALTPPGAPAPLGKTLTQIEPRIDLSTLPSSATAVISITVPGSYYATSNIAGAAGKHTIEVLAGAVTIDLNGYSITNTDAASAAIQATIFAPTTVRNGRVTGGAYGVRGTARLVCTDLVVEGGTTFGILGGADSHALRCRVAGGMIQLSTRGLVEDCITTSSTGVAVGVAGIVRGTRVSGGGISGSHDAQIYDCTVGSAPANGIEVGDRAIVRNCSVGTASRSGILAQDWAHVSGCTITIAGNSGAAVTDAGIVMGTEGVAESCTVRGSLVPGFIATTSAQLRNCIATTNTGIGFFLGNQARLTDCTATSNTGLGISVGSRSSLSGCISNANAGGGIYATGSGALIDHCVAIGNSGGSGIRVDTGAIRDCEVRETLGAAGIRASTGSLILRNISNANGISGTPQDGFLIEGGRSRVEGNHSYNNLGNGYVLTNTSSTNSVLFISNSAGSNDVAEFSLGSNNAAGPIITFSGVATNTNPGANFNL